MDKLRKHIRESFFNPVLHFLPLLVFLVVDDLFGLFAAWIISFPLAIILLVYIYFLYRKIFNWHLVFTLFYVLTGLISTAQVIIPLKLFRPEISYEIVILSFFAVFIIFHRQIQKHAVKRMSSLIPMTNNFDELFKFILAFSLVILGYIFAFLFIRLVDVNILIYNQLLSLAYTGILIFILVYEVLRVQIIRSKLIQEKWLPIVNNQGKIIGSIQQQTSFHDEKKYQHPVIRVLIVDKGMILLSKTARNGTNLNELWDCTVSNHIVMDETIEHCVERTVKDELAFDNFKYMFLSTYAVDCEDEIQYSFLFVSCLQSEYKFNPEVLERTKWWTQKQMAENIDSGIFTENFKIEYDLVKRSGLLETGRCECNCRLKDIIYQQSNVVNSGLLIQ
jgi:isopentenyldiphosphate isomerase